MRKTSLSRAEELAIVLGLTPEVPGFRREWKGLCRLRYSVIGLEKLPNDLELDVCFERFFYHDDPVVSLRRRGDRPVLRLEVADPRFSEKVGFSVVEYFKQELKGREEHVTRQTAVNARLRAVLEALPLVS